MDFSAAELDDLMRRGWPALTNVAVDGWIARLSEGFTQRANSVLPVTAPLDLHHAVERIEKLYLEHGLAPTFQVSPAAQPIGIDELLAGRGYELRSPTIVQVSFVAQVMRHLAPSGLEIRVQDEPDEDWMDLWWAVDGRAGYGARAVARHILTTGPALYASGRDERGAMAVGRLALVGQWGGIYCLTVRPDARRRGYAMAVLRTLLEHAAGRGVRRVWLQVVADNTAARALYERLGFIECSDYHYRTLVARDALLSARNMIA